MAESKAKGILLEARVSGISQEVIVAERGRKLFSGVAGRLCSPGGKDKPLVRGPRASSKDGFLQA